MERDQNGTMILSDQELNQIFGGRIAPSPRDWSKEDKGILGAGMAGALFGGMYGAPGGPIGAVSGAVAGAGTGIGSYMINSYVNGGDRSRVPGLHQEPLSWGDFRRMENRK